METNIVPITKDLESEEFKRLFDSPKQRAARAKKMEALNRKREARIHEEAKTLALSWILQGVAIALGGIGVGLLLFLVF
jgi:hypothetical protein